MNGSRTVAWGPLTFFTLVIVGLLYMKWLPYYDRAFIAAARLLTGLGAELCVRLGNAI